MRKIIKLTLIKIGIRCDLIGFVYLCYAVELVILDPELSFHLCKELYVKIGEKFNVAKTSSIERSIRHAIDIAQVEKNFLILNEMFGSLLYSINDKPTSGELIRLVAEYYRLGLYKE